VRIALVTDLAEEGSGGNQMFLKLADLLAEEHEVYLIAGRAGPTKAKTLCNGIYRSCPQPHRCPHLALLFLLCAAWQLAKLRPDVIHTNSHLPNLLAWLHPRRTIATIHHLEHPTNPLAAALTHAIQTAELKAPHALLISPMAKLTPRTVQLPPLYQLPPCPPAEKQPGLVAMVGRLEKRKHYDLALLALRHALRSNPDLHMVIVGDGPERPTITRLIDKLGLKNRVTLAGHLPEHKKLETLARSEIFLHTGYPEGYVIAAVEAHHCRNKIVTHAETPALKHLKCNTYPYTRYKIQEIAAALETAHKNPLGECKTLKETKEVYKKIYQILY
jgi:glycosyltransferase involved in cell wall biosynthesis